MKQAFIYRPNSLKIEPVNTSKLKSIQEVIGNDFDIYSQRNKGRVYFNSESSDHINRTASIICGFDIFGPAIIEKKTGWPAYKRSTPSYDDEFTPEYPLGGMLEPYDIERDMQD
ncbi:MAG: hypothetical protein WC737_05775 [Parcubacteria group bacterium]|jgi:hypothetical protein